jgi:serine/threonine-protein kinase
MNPNESASGDATPLPVQQRVDAVCRCFEDAWLAGTRPRVEEFLNELPADERPVLLRELLGVEVAYRRQQGETPGVEEYRARFPELFDTVLEAVFGVGGSAGCPGPDTVDDGVPGAAAPVSASGLRYRPVRLYARGGLGEVHLAEDTELVRVVALKRVRPDRITDPGSIRRFLREAEITARLEHPGIVPVYGLVYDAAGQPAYAMRFVEGSTLKEAIDRYHAASFSREPPASARPALTRGSRLNEAERRLAFRQLLHHFIAACNAVAYAHNRGVLHRDLKPSNILLGRFGETLVVDWGLAKIAGTTEATRTDAEGTLTTAYEPHGEATALGQAVGTPAFMSPEQAAGRWNVVGPESDVYSLGTTLYYLLTGTVPFTGADHAEILAKVQRGALAPPYRVKAEVPRALDAVCRKAMALEPAERYHTAKELANDVEHWLADEPVSDYREPVTLRLARWSRRHRGLTAGVAGLLVTAVVGLALGLAAVERERRQTVSERDQKEQALAAEKRARETAMAALRSLTDEGAEQQLARQSPLTGEEQAFLQKVLQHFEDLAALQGDDAASRAIRAEGYHRVGWVRYRLGELKGAEAAYRNALALRKQLAADFPSEPDFRDQVSRTLGSLGILLSAQSRLEEAKAAHREGLALSKQLAADISARPDFRQVLAKQYCNLGEVLFVAGRHPAAEAAITESLAVCKQLVIGFPTRADFRKDLASSQMTLGWLFKNVGRPKEAEAAWLESLAMYKQLTIDFRTILGFRNSLARNHHNLGILFLDTGRLSEAEVAFRNARSVFKQLATDFPGRSDFRDGLARSYNELGAVLERTGRLPEAEEAGREAIALNRQLAAEFPTLPHFRSGLSTNLSNLGGLLERTGRTKEAEAPKREALALIKQLATEFPDRPDFRLHSARRHLGLGLLLRETGRPKEAETALRDAQALCQQLVADLPQVPDYRNELTNAMMELALLLRQRRDFAAARQLLEEAVPHHEAALQANPRHPHYRWYYRFNLGVLIPTLAGLRDQAAAVQTAEKLRDLGWDPAVEAHDAAAALAQCVPVVDKDEQLPAEQREMQAQFYADQAMQMLQQAVAKGYKDVAQLKKDKDLDPIRKRDDFQKLLAELEAKK